MNINVTKPSFKGWIEIRGTDKVHTLVNTSQIQSIRPVGDDKGTIFTTNTNQYSIGKDYNLFKDKVINLNMSGAKNLDTIQVNSFSCSKLNTMC